ncbi:unnamed protein product [Rhizoctonia solani]|uniref:Zn(2)-C6 fungal-type domain-containing protein n=1 Tax=Rhizoctonia solani TaxID=456999 RepID=A0A8H3CRR1_9AGAM|nr:unnamed protein product [Rhizoctonia solani]
MSPSLPSHDTRRRDALSIDALVERPSTRQCGKCQEAQTRCDGREPCRNCEVRGTLCGYAWSSFSAPHTLPPIQQAPAHHFPPQHFAPPAKRRSPVPTGSIFPRSKPLDGGWAIVPQGTNAPTAHPGPVVSCKTCQARNTPCDGVTPVCGSCRIRRLECYIATPSAHPDKRNGNGPTLAWSPRDRQALNPRSFPPSLSQAAMLLPPSRPRAPSDASKPSSSRASLSFMLNPKPEGKLASGSKGNAQRPAELKSITTATTPTHHVTPPTPVAPASMEKAQAVGPMDVDPPTSPGSSTGATNLSRRPSRKRSASPESHYGRERDDSPGRESVSSLGLSALAMSERRNRALSHVHSPRSSIDSHPGRLALEPHSPRGSLDPHSRASMDAPRNSLDSHRNSVDSHMSPRGSMDSHSPTRSARSSVDLHSRGQPLDEARGLNGRPADLHHSNRPVEPPNRPELHSHRPGDAHSGPHSNLLAERPMEPPNRPMDAHRRSIDSLASPTDPNRPRSRSKSSLSHLLDGAGFGGITPNTAQNKPLGASSTSPTHTTSPHTSPTHTNASPVYTTARPPRTPSGELAAFGPSPQSHGPAPSPKAFGPGPSPTAALASTSSNPTASLVFARPSSSSSSSPTVPFGPQSPTSASEPFSRPMSAESFNRPVSADSFARPVSAESFNRPVGRDLGHRDGVVPTHRDSNPPAQQPNSTPIHPAHKQASISTALADMQLKSAVTSRASSPGQARDVFVHSAFTHRHYPNWTFGVAGENMAERKVSEGRMANVWRHETEAGMRRREAEAELRKQDAVELQRRRSEGAKRRKLEEDEPERGVERRMSVVDEREPEKREDRRMSIVEPERISMVEPERMSIVEPEKRTDEPEKRMSGIETNEDRRMSIVEHVRRATDAAAKDGNRASNSLPIPRATADVFGRARRGSAPMPGAWMDSKQSVIVISDSPELVTADTEMDVPEPSEKLFPSKPDSSVATDPSTPLGPFGHIWPAPVITDSGKKGRRPKDPEPAPTRSFITRLNLPLVPQTTQVKQSTPVDDETKEASGSQPSVLRSMLTTMPPRAAFVAAVQSFLSQPATKTRRNRAVIMTKSLMKDALGVLLDPNTDPLLKDHVLPEKKDEDKDGTRRKLSVAIDPTDHTSLEFRAWAKRMFSTVKTNRGEDALAFDGKPVVVEDDIYETIVICHSQGNHCSTEETAKLVDQEHSWVPRALIEAFVQKCPGCPLENKMTSTTAKPRKRKSVRPARRKPTTRRGKKQDESVRRSRKSGKVSEESDGDEEEDELKESGDEAGPADKTDPDPEPAGEDPDQDQDQDEPEPDADEPDEAEEPEMESEDELVSRPFGA